MVNLHFTLINGKGNKPPFFLIHTIPFDSSYLQNSLSEINFDRDLYLVDLPNHGESDDQKVETLNFEKIANRIEDLRQDLGLNKIVMYGHGIGGFVAQHYVLTYGKYLDALVLSNTSSNAKYRKEMAWNIRDKFSSVTIQALNEYAGLTDDKSVRVRFTQSLAAHFDPMNHEKAKGIMDGSFRISTEAYVYLSQYVIPKHDLRERLRKIKVTTLLLGGKEDVWPKSALQFLENDISHARSLLLDGGHFPMIDNPKLYWNTIRMWLNDDLNQI